MRETNFVVLIPVMSGSANLSLASYEWAKWMNHIKNLTPGVSKLWSTVKYNDSYDKFQWNYHIGLYKDLKPIFSLALTVTLLKSTLRKIHGLRLDGLPHDP